MSEQDNVAENINLDETLDLDLSQDDTEDVGALKERLAKAEEAKRQIHARAIRAEKALKEKDSAPQNTTSKEYSLNDEIVDLRLDGYSKDEVAFIMKNGGRKELEDKNSYLSIAINTKKEQARAEAQANKIVDNSTMSEVERKYTPAQLEAMTSEELEKILPHA